MSTPVTYITKTVKLAPGEPFTVPPGAEILYVSDSNSIQTDCIEIPVSGPLKCYSYKWAIEKDSGGGSGAWRDIDTFLENLVLGGDVSISLEHIYGDGQFEGDTDPNHSKLYEILHDNAELPGEIFTHYISAAIGERWELTLVLRLPAMFGDNSYLDFSSTGGVEGARIYSVLCDDCCSSSAPEA